MFTLVGESGRVYESVDLEFLSFSRRLVFKKSSRSNPMSLLVEKEKKSFRVVISMWCLMLPVRRRTTLRSEEMSILRRSHPRRREELRSDRLTSIEEDDVGCSDE